MHDLLCASVMHCPAGRFVTDPECAACQSCTAWDARLVPRLCAIMCVHLVHLLHSAFGLSSENNASLHCRNQHCCEWLLQ